MRCGAVLTEDTVLDRDLVGCGEDGLVIGADGITVDLDGHTVTGLGAAETAGVRNRGHDHVVIEAGATGVRVLRADSAYYGHEVIAAAPRQGAVLDHRPAERPVRAAIAAIDRRRVDHDQVHQRDLRREQQRWISDAEVAEIGYTAFTSRPKAQHVSARLIVRRVPDLNPANQSELFTVYRYHAVFTNSPLPMLAAEAAHRAHAIVEQVIADLKNGPLAHLPSGSFPANSAWLVCAAIAFNLTRAAGTLASTFHAKATTATIRAHLINVPARLARSARAADPAPTDAWPWQQAWQRLLDRCEQPTAPRPDPSTRPTGPNRRPPRRYSRPARPIETRPQPAQRQDHAVSMITGRPAVDPGLVEASSAGNLTDTYT